MKIKKLKSGNILATYPKGYKVFKLVYVGYTLEEAQEHFERRIANEH